jgi:citrate synthase
MAGKKREKNVSTKNIEHETMSTKAVAKGLEGIEVDESAISLVDGERGQLSYRGIDVGQLTERPFSAVAALVLDGDFKDEAEQRAFDRALFEHGVLNRSERELLGMLAATQAHPMQVLQSMAPVLDRPAAFDAYGEGAQGLVIAAKLPQIVAGLTALRQGAPIPEYPNEPNDFTRRFLLQLPGATSEARERAFRVTQVLQIDHGFNASTFAARVTASTLAPVENAVSAAFGTLHGRLHGGADQGALETADRVGSPERAAAFVDDCIAERRRVMGMGHREYKVLDPRARFVKFLAGAIATTPELRNTYDTLVQIEARFRERMEEKGKSLYANLEFYKGVIYRGLGLTPEYFTAGFAMARVFGYVAHFIESRRDNRLIRPAVRYVGKLPAATEDRADR